MVGKVRMKLYYFGRKILRNKLLTFMCRYQCKDSVTFKGICIFKKLSSWQKFMIALPWRKNVKSFALFFLDSLIQSVIKNISNRVVFTRQSNINDGAFCEKITHSVFDHFVGLALKGIIDV